jgi:hypothetical protein
MTVTLKAALRPVGTTCKYLGKFVGKRLSPRHTLSQVSDLAAHAEALSEAAKKRDSANIAGHTTATAQALGQADFGYDLMSTLRE